MSLKVRLRLLFVALVIAVVSALSALNLYNMAVTLPEDALQRIQMSAQQVKSLVVDRIRERIAGRETPRTLPEIKALWAEAVRDDTELAAMLQNTLANSRVIVEILVVGQDGRILMASTPGRAGELAGVLPDFETWVRRGAWKKLQEIFTRRQDLAVSIPLGVAGTGEPVIVVKVIGSSVLLREMMLPQVRHIALIFAVALLLATLLAVTASNLALRPLATISQALDRISRGEQAKESPAAENGTKEFAIVQSKLSLLGQQFRGAKENAQQLRTNVEQLLERLEEVVLLFDREDRLMMAGRAAEQLLGRGRWEMMGRTLTELFPPTSVLGETVHSAIQLRQPLRNHPLTLERNGEPGVRLLVNVETLEAFPLHERIGTLITLRDAETRRQLQSQLDVSTRLAAISRLTGGVAHEIKNPLQAIRVHLEVLRAKLEGEGAGFENEIGTIDREIMRLDRVVKTFLDFTRPVDLKMQALDLAAVVREVGVLVAPAAERRQVRVESTIGSGELPVSGDRDLLTQALLNVVVNGVEAMEAGGRLQIRAERAGDDCSVTITDQGPGIPAEIRDRIFQLYFSTKGKGSGIGLAMTFRIVQLHNGSIEFTSEPGQGTTFRLRFPARS